MRVMYIQADDWAGVYVDGRLAFEGHSIPSFEWLAVLERAGVEVDRLGETPEAYAAIEAEGRCPAEWPPSDTQPSGLDCDEPTAGVGPDSPDTRWP